MDNLSGKKRAITAACSRMKYSLCGKIPDFLKKSGISVPHSPEKRCISWFCWLTILSLLLVSCNKQEAKPVTLTISSGMALKSSMEEIKELYTQEEPNVTITYNFDSGGNLKNAIEQGLPVDIFITSDYKSMDDLQSKGFSIADTRRILLSNKIVLIAPKDATNISNFKDLTGTRVKKVALPNPKSSASGDNAQQVLTFLGILEQVKPKIVVAPTSADVASFVEKGNADAGILFATDAILSNKVRVVAIAPENSHSPIVYSAVVLKDSKNIPEAKSFVKFLQTDRAEAVFVKYGFTILTDRKASL